MYTNLINAILLNYFVFWFCALLITNILHYLATKYLQIDVENIDFNWYLATCPDVLKRL